MIDLLPLFIFSAYILGSIPTGILVAKIFGTPDPRTIGSGNIGASNLARAGGFKLGVITFIADFAKGSVPTLLSTIYFSDNPWIAATIGVACVFGHCYSIFLKFRGGKGVATSTGILFVLSPLAALIGLLAWCICFFVTRVTSLCAIFGMVIILTAMVELNSDWTYCAAAAACAILIVRRHRENWEAVLAGTERHF